MSGPSDPLLSVRAFLVFFSALLTGTAAGSLSYLATPNVASASLVGMGAFAVALPLVHSILARD